MSILIKGMEMPTRCCDCKMYVEDIYCCHLLHREIENPWADDGVELDCPLVPVPPHGRLIDADALHEELYALEYARENEWLDGVREARGVDAARVALLDAPTVIEAEED